MTRRDYSYDPQLDALYQRARNLGLWSVVENWQKSADLKWVKNLIESEEVVRSQRSLARRLKRAKLPNFPDMTEFNWAWPNKIDRRGIEELFSLSFMEDASNVVLLGGAGVGKSMIARNIAHKTILGGHTARFINGHELLTELADYATGTALLRRIKSYARIQLLVIDELGYLAFSEKKHHADLLFQLINARYGTHSTIITSNKTLEGWQDMFRGAACTTAIIDRLTHRAEVFNIVGESFRKHQATERRKDRKERSRTQSKRRES
jgi:DNA replication protein DnaC